jgi:flagellar protein FlgJ
MPPSAFLDMLLPAALECQRVHGIPASFTLAQAALESRWGDSDLAQRARNLFGIKADKSWHGATFNLRTGEVFNGREVVVPASWRKYATWAECLEDRAAFFTDNHRYAACWAETTGAGWIREVAKAGYATDPAYATKLLAVMRGRNLQRFDPAPVVAA